MLPVIAALGVGYALGRKGGKKKQNVYWPELKSSYLPWQTIEATPWLAPMAYLWDWSKNLYTAPTAVSPSGILSAFQEAELPLRWALKQDVLSPEAVAQAITTVGEYMRPAWEQDVARQLEFTREQLAGALGTPTGGAVAEVMRRQLADMQSRWQQTLAQVGLRELEQRRGLMQEAWRIFPQFQMTKIMAPTLPIQALYQASMPFMGTWVAPQVVHTPRQPSFLEQVLPLAFAAALGGLRI